MSTLAAIHRLGVLLLAHDGTQEAELFLQKAVETMRQVLGEDDENT